MFSLTLGSAERPLILATHSTFKHLSEFLVELRAVKSLYCQPLSVSLCVEFWPSFVRAKLKAGPKP